MQQALAHGLAGAAGDGRISAATRADLAEAAASVLVTDGHAGNNLIYLPIDKLLEKSTAREPEQTSESATGNSSKDQDQVTIEARSRGER